MGTEINVDEYKGINYAYYIFMGSVLKDIIMTDGYNNNHFFLGSLGCLGSSCLADR